MTRGAYGSRNCTLFEVAAELGVSMQRAYQIERAALSKARAYMRSRGLSLADVLPAGTERTHPMQQIIEGDTE